MDESPRPQRPCFTMRGGMKKSFVRKPIGNFFVLKDLQVRLIVRIVIAGVISTIVAAGTLLVTYLLKYNSISFWAVNLGQNADIADRGENIVYIILPSLAISTLVNIVVTACIGLYASRKYAVPIYKLEQWAILLRKGNLNAKLRFREKEELKVLSNHCNVLADDLRTRFQEIKKHVASLHEAGIKNDDVTAIEGVLSAMDLDAEQVEVNTNFYAVPPEQERAGSQEHP